MPFSVVGVIMLAVKVHPVDPRDQTAELDDPAYRVYFWSGERRSGFAMACDEYEVTDADVHDVIRWAEDHADGRTYSLWACVPDYSQEPLGLQLVRLAGWDPTASDEDRPRHAVGVPASATTGVL